MMDPAGRRSTPLLRTSRKPKVGPTDFHICIANLTVDNQATLKAELRDSISHLWNSPFRNFCYGPQSPASMSLVMQANSNSDALTATEVVNQEPNGHEISASQILRGYYESPSLSPRADALFLDYEPYTAYAPNPDPVDAGFDAADRADGKLALDYFADGQRAQINLHAPHVQYGIYWFEITNKPILSSRQQLFVDNCAAGVFNSYDIMYCAFYAFYEDTESSLYDHYKSYYDAAVAGSAAAQANGYTSFRPIPLLRVRTQHAAPQTTLTDNQAAAWGRLCATEQIPDLCFWYQRGADENLLGGLQVMWDAYVENL